MILLGPFNINYELTNCIRAFHNSNKVFGFSENPTFHLDRFLEMDEAGKAMREPNATCDRCLEADSPNQIVAKSPIKET